MKTVPLKNTLRQGVGCLLAILLFMTAPADTMAADKPSSNRKEVFYSVRVTKTQNNKRHHIRLYGNGQDKILCSVNGVQGMHYQVFIFNVESKLVNQTSMNSGETVALNNISKGNYLFEVLVKDEHIESGQLTIK